MNFSPKYIWKNYTRVAMSTLFCFIQILWTIGIIKCMYFWNFSLIVNIHFKPLVYNSIATVNVNAREYAVGKEEIKSTTWSVLLLLLVSRHMFMFIRSRVMFPLLLVRTIISKCCQLKSQWNNHCIFEMSNSLVRESLKLLSYETDITKGMERG